MAYWYRTSKLAGGLFRNFALGSHQLMGSRSLGLVSRAPVVLKTGIIGYSLRFGQQTPNCLVYLRSGYLGGLKQTPVHSLLVAKRRYCDQMGFKQLQLITADKYSKVPKKWMMGICAKFGFGRNNFVDVGGRYYYVDGDNVHHFKRRICRWDFLIAGLVCLGLTAITYLTNRERIPYAKRTHLVLMPRKVEKMFGERQFNKFKAKHEGNFLPATHPTSVRVKAIADKVIKALERGLRDDKVWGGPNYASRASQYLSHVDWEVFVVHERVLQAFCFPGGKIVLFSADFKYFNSDAEIAYIIAHEVGHVVARHQVEMISKGIIAIILDFFMPILFIKAMCRRLELEADYIGVLLMACAGYDPSVAMKTWMKLSRARHDRSIWRAIKREHPSYLNRARAVARAQEEAMEFYRESLCPIMVEQEQ